MVSRLGRLRTITAGSASARRLASVASLLLVAACGHNIDDKRPALKPQGSGDALAAACSDAKLVSAALAALDDSCYSCHGAGGATKGGPKDVTDLAALVASGVVVPKDANDSPLLKVVRSGTMPPKGTPPSQAELDALQAWIDGGAPVIKGAQLAAASASCANGAGSGGAAGDASGGGAGSASGLALTAADVLSKYCGSCHDGGKSAGGLGDITNLQHLIDAGEVVAGNPAGSSLLGRMTSTTSPMPPKGSPAPAPAEIQAVSAWIQAGAQSSGGAGTSTGAASGNGTGGGATPSPSDIFTLVAEDLQKLAATSSSPAPFTRYISFAHLAADGVGSADLKDYANGAGRLANSMSTNRRITAPVAIDPAGSIIRLDIRDYNWTQQNWEDILAAYPYLTLQRSESLKQQFRELAQTDLPVVNGDWFAFTASQAPLYNELLQLPNDEAGLEQRLGFSIANDLSQTLDDTASKDTDVARAGFSQSKVAINDRVIERHEIADGSYWRSYDFKDAGANANPAQEKVKSVFAAPLGPARDIKTDIAFQEDAGEIIFSLPNGLQGYFLVDGNTNKLDAAALDVAQDASREKRVVLNGYSCMGCHAPGILPKTDEVGPFVASGGGFTADELTLIRRLYGKQAELDADTKGDTERYIQALTTASIDPTSASSQVRAGNVYEKDITLSDAAAVVGLTTQDFQNLLNNSSAATKQALAGLVAGGTVTREAFEAQFPQLVVDFFGNIPAP